MKFYNSLLYTKINVDCRLHCYEIIGKTVNYDQYGMNNGNKIDIIIESIIKLAYPLKISI